MRITSTKTLLLLLSGAVLFLISCQKELSFQDQQGNTGGTGGNNRSIIGDYDFVGVLAHTSSTITVTAAGDQLKTVTVSDYAGKDYTGTTKITSNQIIATGIGYSVDTVMNAKSYINGLLIDDSNYPFVATIPPTSNTTPYVQNNADSITVTGPFGLATDPSGNAPTGSVGERISWSGDTLIFKTSVSFTQSITQGGVPAVFTGTINATTKLKKR
ncbi:MAG: hypothetical protein Q8941_19335 [Bacteroidota bacterium]|nr:hypothetical protein [Bacteroidota bacterium]